MPGFEDLLGLAKAVYRILKQLSDTCQVLVGAKTEGTATSNPVWKPNNIPKSKKVHPDSAM